MSTAGTDPRPTRPGPPGDLLDALGDVATRTPAAPALVAGDTVVTYEQLARDVDAVASWLAPVEPEAVVALEADRSREALVAFLAVLAAGGTALLLDPSHPARRRDEVVGRSRATRRLAVGDVADVLRRPGRARRRPGPPPPAQALAYVGTTSGSSGAPRAVGVTRAALAARLAWGQDVYPLGPGDRVLWHTAPSFDFSLWEMLAPLAHGACVVVGGPLGQGDLRRTAQDLVQQRVTAVHFVPSVLRAFLRVAPPEALAGLRHLFLGGEALDGALLHQVRAATGARVHNQYGPTEACIDVTWFDCTDFSCGPTDPVPIGTAAPGVALTLVGPDGLPTPGDEGELAIAGDCLARGYLGEPRATADRFVPDPQGPPGARLYRTGDRVRRRADGLLEFVGRLDDQVKVHGIRVEPEEVRRAVQDCAPGADVAVTARRPGDGEVELVAFVAGEPAVTPDELARRLPAGMVPRLVPVPALTRMPSGKVDLAAMVAALGGGANAGGGPDAGGGAGQGQGADEDAGGGPGQGREADEDFATDTEARLAAVWAGVLAVPRVRPTDNFFELGGHSLMATEVVALIEDEMGVELPLVAFFDCETLADLAQLTDGLVTGAAGEGR